MRRADQTVLPGLLLVLLACGGVAALLMAASPSLRAYVPSVGLGNDDPRPRPTIAVTDSATPTPRPTPTRPTAAPTAAPSATGTTRPTTSARPTTAPTARPTAPTTTAPPRPTTPPPPRCTAGTATLAPVADAYVDQGSPGANYGGSPTLLVAGRDKDRNRRALVRFTLPRIPNGCTLRAATLSLAAKEPTQRRVLVARATRGWSESSVTWGSAPGISGLAASATVSSTRVSWTVTTLVDAMRTAGNYGFVLRDAGEGDADGVQTNFGARTSRTAPVLTLRWS